MAYSTSPQVIAVTETWLTTDILTNEILPVGYSIFRCDRNSRGGGVLLCVDERLPSKLMSSLPEVETLIVTVGANPAFTICLSYKPPNASMETIQDLYSIIGNVATESNVIIMGDFNCPDIDWVSLTAETYSSSLLCDVVFDNNLSQLVITPTHVRGNILDLVLTNSESLFKRIWVDETNDYSDHFMIYFAVYTKELPPKGPKYSYVPDYSKVDFEGMCSFLLDHDFSDYLVSNNIDELWLYFKLLLHEAVDLFVPKARVSLHNSPKWFTPEIRHAINKLRFRRRKFMKNPSSKAQADI